jgi:hypothetical protein
MKKVLMGHDEQISINTSNSSVPNSSITESNEMILMDINNPILDDDDSHSIDFVSDSNPIYPDDDASLNSSQSSLQHPSSTPLHSLLIDRQISTTSQPIQSQMISNINRRFSSIDMKNTNQISLLNPLPPLQINIDELHHPIRTDVRRYSSSSTFKTFDFLVHYV